MSSDATNQIDKQLRQIDDDMRRRDEQVSALASGLARQGEAINNIATTVGSLTSKLDQAMSQMQTMAGRSGRIDLPTISAVVVLMLALWGFAIAPQQSGIKNNAENMGTLKSQIDARDRETLKESVAAAEERGFQRATIGQHETQIAGLGAAVGAIRDTRYSKDDAKEERRETMELMRAERLTSP